MQQSLPGQKEKSTKESLIYWGVVAVRGGAIGSITGLGLSFTALPALASGAIIAAVPAMLLCAFMVYMSYKCTQLSRDDIIYPLSICLTSAAIGVGLAAAATAIFPGVMLSAAALGGLIGAIAPIAGFAVAFFPVEFIIKPIVDKVSECFTSPNAEPATPLKGSGEAAPAL